VEPTDQECIHLLTQGDIGAYEKVFIAFFGRLHRYAHLTVDDSALAEEIVQEIFLRVWEKKEKLSIHTSLKAWLYAAVYHECLLHLKKQKQFGLYQATIVHREKNAVSGEDASQKIKHTQLEERFLEALNRLPEQCRIIFQLNRVEKLKYQEVASALGLSVKTVENQMGKALKLLRVSLAEFLPLLIFVLWY
jgi:RNA polymerase sigma-70 factor (ECF subfamily)